MIGLCWCRYGTTSVQTIYNINDDDDDYNDNNNNNKINNNNNNNNRGGHGLEDRGIVVLFLTETRIPSPLQIVHTVSGVHSASYLEGTGVSFLRNKSAEP